MKLKIRYDDQFQTIELNYEDTEKLWVSLDLEGDNLPQEEREKMIQAKWDEQYNKPEYNAWHKSMRHIDPTPKVRRFDGKPGYIQGDPDDDGFDALDYLAVTDESEELDRKIEEEELYKWLLECLGNKNGIADAFFAVYINGENVKHYAERAGDDANNLSHRLVRAKKKIKSFYEKRPF